MMNVLILDTETTCLDKKRLVQLAFKKPMEDQIFNELYCPPIPISAGASAQSHITDEDVIMRPAFKDTAAPELLQGLLNSHILVAHNAAFDIEVLANEGIKVPYHLCTKKIAQRLIQNDDMESYSLQYLRYYLKLYQQEKEKYVAHDARGDILILENLFMYLFQIMKQRVGKIAGKNEVLEVDVLAGMHNLQEEPLVLNKIGFGKHAGMKFTELANKHLDYIVWLKDKIRANKEEGKDPDLWYTLNFYIDKAYPRA